MWGLDERDHDRVLRAFDALLWLFLGFFLGAAFVAIYGGAPPCN